MKLSKRMTFEVAEMIALHAIEVLPTSVAIWADEVEQLEAENETLREYATHKPGCHENSDECICGLDALLTGADDEHNSS